MKYKDSYVASIIREMELRKDYTDNEPLETIYFGGGTPSQLQAGDFEKIFSAIYRLFNTSDYKEITLEANPDDITPDYLTALRSFPFNRISMGVQSFKDSDLHFLNRRHNSKQAIQAVELCKRSGITNISIDLIYGLPDQTENEWEHNLNEVIRMDIPHISAYHLIYEEGTALYKLMEAGKIQPVAEDLSVNLFSVLIDKLESAGYQHYETSNFAKPGYISQHNSSYWTGKKYLGLGPSAHSYNGIGREWNISSLPVYIKGINAGKPVIEKEELSLYTRYNDYIITGLRTIWGIDLRKIRSVFGNDIAAYCERQADTHKKQEFLIQKDDHLTLSRKGIFISDSIMSDLLWV